MTFLYDIEKLAQRKAALGLTDQMLARRAGLHPSTIKNILTGRTCKPPTIRKIAEALGMDLAELVVPADAEPARKTQEEPAA